MTITREEFGSSADTRYIFDNRLPSDYAQLDTSEDASWYGNWASAQRLSFVSYCEGDCTITKCDTVEEFKAEFQRFREFCDRLGYVFKGIDPGWMSPNKDQWHQIGLHEYLH